MQNINQEPAVEVKQAGLSPGKSTPSPNIKRHRSFSEENAALSNINHHAEANSHRKSSNRLHLSFLNDSENQCNTTCREMIKEHDLLDSNHYKYKLNAKRIGKMKSHLPKSHLPGNTQKDSQRHDSLINKLKAMHISSDFDTNPQYQTTAEEVQPKFIDIEVPEGPTDEIEAPVDLISEPSPEANDCSFTCVSFKIL